MFDLTGRTALVTGASGGIGRAIALALSDAGARVALSGTREAVLQEVAASLKGESASVACNLSDPAAVDPLVGQAEAALGPVDILVANAGTADRVPLKSMEESDFNEVLDLNVTAQWLLSKALFPLLSVSGKGRVINIASIYSTGASVISGLGAYTTSKHALVGLTKSQAVEWARHGITANAIAPAYFPTELTETALADEEMSARLRTFTPQDRFGEPTDLAPALLFLASPASAYTTGAIVPVDGGWTAW